MRLHAFDLDHTLLTVNSSFSFGWHLFRHRPFSRARLLCLLPYCIGFRMGFLSVTQLHRFVFSRLFLYTPAAEILAEVEQFIQQTLSALLYSPALERLREAQAQGHHIAILSSGPAFLVSRIAKQLEIDHWFATMYTVGDDGRFQAIAQVLEGAEKAEALELLLERWKLTKESATVYSDSILDLPLLKSAGRVVGVRPDRPLRNLCLSQGWEIL